MKTTAIAAVIFAAANACLVDDAYSCDAVPSDFYVKQREAYMLYYSLMRSHGYDINTAYNTYNWEQPTSKYAYQEYIPGENPYLGRWASRDNYCWLTAKDAVRVKAAEEAYAEEQADMASKGGSWGDRMGKMRDTGYGYKPV